MLPMSYAPDLELHVREALASDAPRIAALATQLGYEVPPAHAERFLSARNDERELFVAVVPRVGVVGWLGVAVAEHLTASRHAELEGMVVEDEFRGVGVGRALIERAERWARDRRCVFLRLRSNVVRERAHGFYERNGYVLKKGQHVFEKPL